MAGLKPREVYEATLKEVLTIVEAYDEDRMNYFNLNTRIIAWYATAPHVQRMPPFESFLTIGDETNSPQTLSERAAFIRARYKELGYLK